MNKKLTKTKTKKSVKKIVAKKKDKPVRKTQGKLVGKVSHYFDHIKVAAIKLKDNLKKGDKIRIEGGTTVLILTISSMQKDHKPVTKAGKKDEIGIKVAKKVREGYRVFKT
jgi:hypothetical protein